MARFGGQSGPSLRPLPGSRPNLLKCLMMPPVPGIPYERIFRAEIDTISVDQLDGKFVALLALDHTDAMTGGMLDEYTDDVSQGPRVTTSDLNRVWKTTAVCEQIAEDHPRLVRFDHRDPFFGIPILNMPSTTLEGFLARHKSTMYHADRIVPKYRPLIIYQWALHLISGLSFVHSKDIVFGDLRIEVCWLEKDLSLLLLGFLDAVYKTPGFSKRYINQGGRYEHEPFHPCHKPRWDSLLATTQTDLFVWGCLIYELMTGFWPGHERQRSDAEIRALFLNRQWPLLETEYLGGIVRKCWDYEYQDTEHLKTDLIHFLKDAGWEVDGDELRGFRATELFQDEADIL